MNETEKADVVAAIKAERRMRPDVPVTPRRLASLTVASAYLAVAVLTDGLLALLLTAAFLVVPLNFIWFSESVGRFSSSVRITKTTPASIVEGAGWALLLAPILMPIAAFVIEHAR